MSIVTTRAALQALHATIDGIREAPTKYPTSLNAVDLPCVLSVPGPADWGWQAVGLMKQRRVWYVRLYVAPLATGQGVDETLEQALGIVQAMGEAYLNDITLGGAIAHIGSVSEDALFRDGGIVALEFAGMVYRGCELQVLCIEKTT